MQRAGIVVLEELEHAKKRGATIYCELGGYGCTADAYHITAPAEGAEGGFRGVDQIGQCQVLATQLDAQLRAAALAVGRGDNAIGAAEPGQYVFMLQRRVTEVLEKLLLNQLPGEGRRARAG